MSVIDACEVRATLRAVRDSDLRIIDPARARMVERAIELMATADASSRSRGVVLDHATAGHR